MKTSSKQPNLELPTTDHCEECSGNRFLELCARQKAGEIRIFSAVSGKNFGQNITWAWKVYYKILGEDDMRGPETTKPVATIKHIQQEMI